MRARFAAVGGYWGGAEAGREQPGAAGAGRSAARRLGGGSAGGGAPARASPGSAWVRGRRGGAGAPGRGGAARAPSLAGQRGRPRAGGDGASSAFAPAAALGSPGGAPGPPRGKATHASAGCGAGSQSAVPKVRPQGVARAEGTSSPPLAGWAWGGRAQGPSRGQRSSTSALWTHRWWLSRRRRREPGVPRACGLYPHR